MRNKVDYSLILRDADIKKKQAMQEIKRNNCSDCGNCGKGCLKLEHIFKDGKEIYRCANYKSG